MFSKIRPIQWGVALSVIALILSFSAGMYMGVFEDATRAAWSAMYKGDPKALSDMLDIAWNDLVRAHLHWGALGASALAASFVLLQVKVPNWYKQAASTLLGLGAIIYPICWLYVANHVTAVGSDAAKANIHWLAVIGIGCMMLGTLAVFVSLILTYFKERKPDHQEKAAA